MQYILNNTTCDLNPSTKKRINNDLTENKVEILAVLFNDGSVTVHDLFTGEMLMR